MSRTKTVLKGSLAMLMARGIGTISNLLIISILARHLTKDTFGLWSVLSSFVVFSGSFDLGLGQGLKNKLAALSASSSGKYSADERDYFLAVFYLLLTIAGIGILGAIAFSPLISWQYLLNIQDAQVISFIIPLITIVISSIFLNLPLGLNISGFLAYQESHWRGLLDILQSTSLLITVFLAIHFLTFNGIVTSYYLTFNLVGFISTLIFIKRRNWSFIWISIKKQIMMIKPLFKISLQFWLLGLSAIIIFSTDPIIVSRVAGLPETGDFSVIQKMFTLLIAVHFTVLTPLWSAYTQAAEKSEWNWIKKNLYRSIYITLGLFILGGGILILSHKFIFKFWIGREINNFSLIIAMAFWALNYSWINCFSVLLNALNKIKTQTILIIISAIVNIPLSLYLGYIYGAVGVALGSIISISPLVVSVPIQVIKILRSNNE